MKQRQRIQATGRVSAKPSALHVPDSAAHKYHSAIDELHQQGSARIRFPNSGPGALQAVLLNTAGGLTGDDCIEWDVEATTYSRLCVSTAACEKVYRTHGPVAVQNTTATVAPHARLDWLPQETIVFNGAALKRSLDAHVDVKATALFVESLILGRQAMNESLSSACIHDRWRIHRGGSLLHAEDLRLNFNDTSVARRQSALHHFSAISTLLLISAEPREYLNHQANRVRQLISTNDADTQAGVSVLDHRLVVRVLSVSSFRLRQFLIPCVELLNEGEPIPPVWNV